jgi:hypothetical protein
MILQTIKIKSALEKKNELFSNRIFSLLLFYLIVTNSIKNWTLS